MDLTYFTKLSVDGFGRNHTTKMSESSIDTLRSSSLPFIILAFEAFLGHVGRFFNWAALNITKLQMESAFSGGVSEQENSRGSWSCVCPAPTIPCLKSERCFASGLILLLMQLEDRRIWKTRFCWLQRSFVIFRLHHYCLDCFCLVWDWFLIDSQIR